MDTQGGKPITVLFESLEQGGIFHHRQHLGRRMAPWEAQNEGVIKQIEVEPFQVTRRRHHIAVMIVARFAGAVEDEVGAFAVFQQPYLIILTHLLKVGDCLLQRNGFAYERNILRYQIQHDCFNLGKFLFSKIRQVAHLAVISARGYRVVNRQLSLGEAAFESNFE